MLKVDRQELLNTILILGDSKDVEGIRLFDYWMSYLGYENVSEVVDELDLYVK